MIEKQPLARTDDFDDRDQLFYYSQVGENIEDYILQDPLPFVKDHLYEMASQLINRHIITPEKFIDITYAYLYFNKNNLPLNRSDALSLMVPESSTV